MNQKLILGALGVIQKNGQILMGLRHQPDLAWAHRKWEFPGGEVEWNERPEETVVREVKEEVGLKVKIVKLLPYTVVQYLNNQPAERKLVFFAYLCRVIGGQERPDGPRVPDPSERRSRRGADGGHVVLQCGDERPDGVRPPGHPERFRRQLPRQPVRRFEGLYQLRDSIAVGGHGGGRRRCRRPGRGLRPRRRPARTARRCRTLAPGG